MFTSLRSRLWLSYALVITVVLSIVAIVLLVFLVRNLVLLRQTQQQLVAVRDTILEAPQRFINDPDLLTEVSQTSNVRVIVFNTAPEAIIDTHPEKLQIPCPRGRLELRWKHP